MEKQVSICCQVVYPNFMYIILSSSLEGSCGGKGTDDKTSVLLLTEIHRESLKLKTY